MIASALFDGGVTAAGVATIYSGSSAHNIKSITYNSTGNYTVVCSFVPPNADWKRVRVKVNSTRGKIMGWGTSSVEAGTNYAVILVTADVIVAGVLTPADAIFSFEAEGI